MKKRVLLIANLLFKKAALTEAFTVSSAQNHKWEEIADFYSEIAGAKFDWVSDEEYPETRPDLKSYPWIFKYDRLLDREIDNSKILNVTKLTKDDFTPIKQGIEIEINKYYNKI